MILPPSSVAASTVTPTTSHGAPSPTPTSSIPGLRPENWSSLIGIITAIVGNILISFALNMQRYAHLRLEREWQEKERRRKKRKAEERGQAKNLDGARKYHPPRHADYTVVSEREDVDDGYVATEADPLIPSVAPSHRNRRSSDADSVPEDGYKQQSYLKSPYWWAGIILMTTGEAGNFLAYGFAPASIVSPLGVVALISNCIIAPFMLKERFRKRDGLGVLIAVAGAVTVVLSANDDNPKLGPDDIWDLITTWEFETYFGITVAVIVGLTVASNRFGEKNILIDLGLVGLFGGYTALSTKGVASMLSYTLWRAITFPVTYLLVAILAFTAIMQIKYVNRALQRFDATQVIPVQFVLFTLSVILGSAILYRDFERTSGDDAGKFVGGCAMTFLGVWAITSGRHGDADDEDEDRDPEPEDAINLIEERYHDEINGLGDDDPAGSSRRSSAAQATSPPINVRSKDTRYNTSHPATPNGSSAGQDSLRLVPSIESDASPSPLTVNPWEEVRDQKPTPSLQRPPSAPVSRHATLSTPLLPSEATYPPPTASTSNPELPTNPPLPHTPIRGISDHLLPQTPGPSSANLTPRLRREITAERLASHRNSMPGPLLASPFSASLSAMVADLKRGGSLRIPRDPDAAAAAAAVRRRESVLGIGASEVDEREIGEPLDRRRTATDDVPSAVKRKRSLSGALGGLWRGVRGQQGSEHGRQDGGGA